LRRSKDFRIGSWSQYIAIFLDALFFYLRRDTVDREPIIFAMGIRETGEYEIL
jgi:putative transposase